jgi:hypothetical protein
MGQNLGKGMEVESWLVANDRSASGIGNQVQVVNAEVLQSRAFSRVHYAGEATLEVLETSIPVRPLQLSKLPRRVS